MLCIALCGCGGGGSSTSIPVGVNPGVASRVELMATSYVNQTNGYCYFKTKVTDGNGLPIPNPQVIFTNLSLTGVLDHTTAVTGANGIATATLYSTIAGFATIQSEVRTGTEQIRDKKTVYFTPFDMAFPSTGGGVTPNLSSINLTSDKTTLLTTPADTDATITATVRDSTGALLLNSAVTFGADSPEVTFPLGSSPTAPVVHTNLAGQASILARVAPSILTTTESMVNITASAVIDAKTTLPAVITLFVKPVTITSITVSANPLIVDSAGTSQITAVVNTNAGLAPNGVAVNFSSVAKSFLSSSGAITPFSMTTGGIATATFTAPTVTADTNWLFGITATANGVTSNEETVKLIHATPTPPVTPPTAIQPVPPAFTVVGANLSITTITISGGVGPYTVTSNNPLKACNDLNANNLCSDPTDSGIWSRAASQIAVTVPAGTAAGSVTLNITDSEVPAKTATVVITIQ